MLTTNRSIAAVFCIGIFCSLLFGQTSRPIRFLSYDEAEPVILASGDESPRELAANGGSVRGIWDRWVRDADREIRDRLELGDEDSIVNLLLFGTSYTKQPRLTENQIDQLAQERSQDPKLLFQAILKNRLEDFVIALANPKDNERLRFAKTHLFKKLKIRTVDDAGKQTIKDFLVRSVRRVFDESAGFASLVEQARKNQEDVFVVRSKMFSRRGLSSDTSLKPNLAVENALAELRRRGLIKKVIRVAIIGPGLEFTDKDEGYDFYPPQTLQPFAAIESLLKLSLAEKSNLQIDTFDLSPKVNSHIAGIANRAKRNEPYTILLPLDLERKFTPEFIKYWKEFGNLIAVPAKPLAASTPVRLDLRSVSIRREYLRMIRAFDTNIVLQSPVLAEKDRYDLIIGTNIFLYYDSFQQGLAMRNLSKMLKDGGILLSNNALIEFPFTPVHSIGYSKTIYSEQRNDADAIVWYRKQ